MGEFYGAEQARIHHERFGDLAADAAALLLSRLHGTGVASGRVVDLGCGSGILAARMVDAGFEVTGVDLSPAMIEIARQHVPHGEFALASVYDLEIPPAAAVAATGEVLQYGTDPRAGRDALAALAARAYTALEPGGVFVGDLSTPGRNLGQAVRHVFHEHDEWMLGMHATEAGGRLDRRIVILVREADGRYRRVDEHHTLVLFDVAEVVGILGAAGFAVEVRSSYTEATASTPAAGWVVFVATKANDASPLRPE